MSEVEFRNLEVTEGIEVISAVSGQSVRAVRGWLLHHGFGRDHVREVARMLADSDRVKLPAGTPVESTCRSCGRKFVYRTGGKRRRVHCSEQCRVGSIHDRRKRQTLLRRLVRFRHKSDQ